MLCRVVGFFLIWPCLAAAECPTLLDHRFRQLAAEDEHHFCAYQGQVVLVVNTASRCGFTPQYEGLERLYQRYRQQGLVVVGFPSNDFNQELTEETDIKRFCRLTFGLEFPVYEKLQVAGGEGTHPFFQSLAASSDGYPRWNFHKYLIGRDGATVQSFATQVAPEDPQLIQAIEDAL